MSDPSSTVSGSASKTRADLIYESFYSGVLGGSVVALFFLVVDAIGGQPLFTPSLMGSVLFSGASAETVSGVRLDMVAWYSLVHFATFAALGTGMTLLVYEVGLHSRHPLLVLVALFAVFEVGFAVAAGLLMPGVMARLGPMTVAAANLLAAGVMGGYLLHEHHPGAWQRLPGVPEGRRAR
jgi:hypothetical protein